MTFAAKLELPEELGAPSLPPGLVDDVLRPMFGAPTVDAVQEGLADWLGSGAILRLRGTLARDPEAEPVALPEPRILAAIQTDLERKAAAVLSPERSFQVRRALSIAFDATVSTHQQIIAEISQYLDHPTAIRDLARMMELHGPADLLAMGWLQVLDGRLPLPLPPVADALAEAFLTATSRLDGAQRDWIAGQWPTVEAPVRDTVEASWWKDHDGLLFPCMLFIGHALADEATVAVDLELRHDPEEAGLEWVRVMVTTTDDMSEVLERLDAAMLRSGVLGCCDDASGAGLVLMTQPAVAG